MGIIYRYFIYLSYNGKKYHGWQIQPNANSVQQVLENCFSTILSEKTAITGAGRTDTGVHAKLMVAHFDTEKVIDNTKTFVGKLNSFLPKDIAIQKIVPVSNNPGLRASNPFLTEFAYQYTGQPDIEKMNEAAATLFDYIDFTSFSKLHTDAKTNNCKIMKAVWKQRGETLVFTIQADRFLRNMVRSVVGTLLEVGKGKMSIDEFKNIIEKKDRCAAGISMPANALYLVDIQYPEHIF